MLARILAAIGRAIKGGLIWFGGLVGAPIYGLFNSLYPGSMDGPPPSSIPPAPDVADLAAEVKAAKAASREAGELRMARSVQTWAIESLLAGAHVPLPPGVPAPMPLWLRGLDRQALEKLGSANSHRVAAHLTGQHVMHGVAVVRPLPIADIRQSPPDHVAGSGGQSFSATLSHYEDDAERPRAGASAGDRRARRDRAAQSEPALRFA